MAQKKHKPEGRPVCGSDPLDRRDAFTYYRWRNDLGDAKSDQVKRLKPHLPCLYGEGAK